MEHKLSAKATKIRHRLTFTRSSSARALALTLVSPIEPNPSSNRPRSATNPESPSHEPTWDRDTDSSRGYSFTDEPGYFRPVSPFIDRQEIGEDLEAYIQHACALLSHSIDRGIPARLTQRNTVPVLTNAPNPAGQPNIDAAPSSLEQHVSLLSAPKPISPETESTEKYDSGVGMSFSSPSQPGRPYDYGVSGTDAPTRFYSNQPSASPPHSPSAGPRFRSQSVATTAEENKRERASSSPIPFPFSPPQRNEWNFEPMTLDSPVSPLSESGENFEAIESELKTQPRTESHNINANKPETSSPAISPPHSGVDRTWLRASRDLQRRLEEKATTQTKEPKPVIRFYSSYNQTTKDFTSGEWSKNFWDRDPSVYSKVSSPSPLGTARDTVSRPETSNQRFDTASTNEEDLSGGYPYQTFAGSSGMSSSSYLGNEINQGRFYSVDMSGSPKNNRRKKASLLLRKLAGLGMKRKENENGVC
ncbi:hypothetical protein N7491_000544 [Penicillium cf. griseofulvum]|uniref:Uncharacterized protein n=1 Tax=Penicillium cf. griseofulvum TaxID=2972120 RepID=A0A9W9JM57_9EURO|nr:hypothetical protein N7472_004093 [Penicillium cf. griseofulvum]KAJ5443183.1 hypothetical protein N7445_004296 [Penicillium cf. griseofulvum]KAJ5451362.1 hypothetical protein N7491_000544 [Penicillium cf. griseofulvum]